MRGRFALALLAVITASPAFAADCRSRKFTWTDTEPAINRRHVFCGTIEHGQPKGFHSRQLFSSSRVVKDITEQSKNRGGIYTAIVVFANGRRKLSTFFPDHCSVEEIIKSIYYAGSHESARHPAWGTIGPSAPDLNASGYCRDDNERPFEIRLGRLKDGRINTAFPN